MEEYVPSMEIHFPALASLVLVETNARFVSAKCVSSYLNFLPEPSRNQEAILLRCCGCYFTDFLDRIHSVLSFF